MSHSTEMSAAKRALLEKYVRGRLAQNTVVVPTIPRRTQGSSVPLSFSQQQMWVLAQLIPDVPLYNESVAIHIPGLLDVEVLKRSFHLLLQRHEAWRTCFPLVAGEPVQKILPELHIDIPVVDVRHLAMQEREAEAVRLARVEVQRPFDLEHGPLLRVLLVRIDEQEHRLYVILHHIIFDGISMYQVLLPELSTLYEALLAGKPSPLPELPVQYADFALWQRQQFQNEAWQEQLAYWQQQLADAPATLPLPADRPHPAQATYRGSSCPVVFSQELTEKLRQLCGREGMTLYMLLLAALSTLLYRYTGQEDILLGTASGGRKFPELQKLLGMFINTLVMRTRPTGEMTFRELLQQVRETTLEAHAHQDMPFEYLVKELAPEREAGQNPFFQVLLMLEPAVPELASGWTLTMMEVEPETSKFDLSLILEDRPQGLLGHIEYSTDLFDASTIERMVRHLYTLLAAIVTEPGQKIADLPLLTEVEHQQLLIEWNATSTPYPALCVHEVFEQQVARHPEAIALLQGEERITYYELNVRANQLAHYLQRQGVGPDTLVALCMERSIEMIVGLLGILKAGGAYVPLDPAYPAERLAFMLEDTGATVLLTQKRLAHLVPSEGLHVLCLDSDLQAVSVEPDDNPVSGTTPDHLAYVMYTSGSTGRPKGVEIRHRSILRLVFGADYVHLDETKVLLHLSPISFDASTFEVWGALLHGARCVLYPERIPTPKKIGEAIRRYSVTTAWLTVSLFNAVIDEEPEALCSVQEVLTGGDALSVSHIRRAMELLPDTQFINGYGPTENTTFTCCYPIPRPLPEHWRSIPIGRPIGNTQVYVLDAFRKPVPVGVPGELYIGGAGLARGYLHRPELTRDRFVPNPFSEDGAGRLYRSGDLVRYLPDGTIEFLGRLDHQVKIRGFRIEPGEIEAVLGQHAHLKDVVVLARKRANGDAYLVAYIVPQPGQTLTEPELRQFLKERLPEYMIPAHWMFLEELPLSPNGKVNRKALPEPELSYPTREAAITIPMTTLHYQLVRIWEEVLQVQPVGIRDNFFALGGHSLLAARMVDRIEKECGKRIALSTLFGAATIEQLAEVLQQGEQADSRTPLVAVQPGGTKRPFFYLHGDWTGASFYCLELARKLGSDQPFYILEPYKFTGLETPPTFEQMAAAHREVLRTVQPQGPYQIGGFCNGGLVAYEMARQLHESGEQVELLVLIDPATPTPYKREKRIIGLLAHLLRVSQGQQLDLFLRLMHVRRYIRMPHYRKEQDAQLTGSGEHHTPLQRGWTKLLALISTKRALRQNWTAIYEWIAAGYVPGAYSGKITVFWDSEDPFRRKDWQPVLEGKDVEMHTIPGNHMTCRTEHLDGLVQALSNCLGTVRET